MGERIENMRKLSLMMALMLCVLVLTGCRQEETVHLGLNAEIVSVDTETETIRVKDPGKEGLFGAGCDIDCSAAVKKCQVLYCNYESGDVLKIALDDLQEGDDVILGFAETEFSKIKDGNAEAYSIQLGTQRLNG